MSTGIYGSLDIATIKILGRKNKSGVNLDYASYFCRKFANIFRPLTASITHIPNLNQKIVPYSNKGVDGLGGLIYNNFIVGNYLLYNHHKGTTMTTNTKPVVPTTDPEFEVLTTTSSKIRYLLSKGKTRSEIAKQLGIRYQHVRNVQLQPLKKTEVK